MDWHTDAPAVFVPAGGAKRPVARPRDQAGADRVVVHVGQLFSNLFFFVQIERIVFRLPEGIVATDLRRVADKLVANPTADLVRTESFPLLHENAQLAWVGKPDDRVDVVGHDDETDARRPATIQLCVQHAQDDPLRLIVIQ